MRRTTYPIISELQYELRIRNWFRGLVFPDVRSTLKVSPKPRLPCFLLAASALCSELCGSLQQLGTQFLRGTNPVGYPESGSCLFWNLKTSDTKNIYCKFLVRIRHLSGPPPISILRIRRGDYTKGAGFSFVENIIIARRGFVLFLWFIFSDFLF